MRITAALTAAAFAGTLIASLAVATEPAQAASISHSAAARADWKKGDQVAAAASGDYWRAAYHQLAAYGQRDAHEMSDLAALISIPETDTTAAQRATAARVTRELNGFFLTPGLYGIPAGNPSSYARADWIKSGNVAAANLDYWLAAAVDELDSYGKRYAAERADLVSLESIPLTSTTAAQRATARADTCALDAFFHTPGVND